VEKELADLLNELPNKSAFIRKAIVAQLDMACPMCRGSGLLPKGLHDHFAPLIAQMSVRACAHCGDRTTIQADPGELAPEARARLEQFFHGGPLYCGNCYSEAPTCGDCGWHITPEHVHEHRHAAHTA
jgi:hypothetical protein